MKVKDLKYDYSLMEIDFKIMKHQRQLAWKMATQSMYFQSKYEEENQREIQANTQKRLKQVLNERKKRLKVKKYKLNNQLIMNFQNLTGKNCFQQK